jgi:hypothetical protein
VSGALPRDRDRNDRASLNALLERLPALAEAAGALVGARVSTNFCCTSRIVARASASCRPTSSIVSPISATAFCAASTLGLPRSGQKPADRNEDAAKSAGGDDEGDDETHTRLSARRL